MASAIPVAAGTASGVSARQAAAVALSLTQPPPVQRVEPVRRSHAAPGATAGWTPEAIARMENALAELVGEGIKTNKALHQEILSHTAFGEGGLDIHYLERRLGLK